VHFGNISGIEAVARQRKITQRKRRTLLTLLAQGSRIGVACEAIKVSRQAVHLVRRREPEFNQQVEDALAVGATALEDEALRRAVEGVDRPVFQGGKLCGHVREYSDTLLLALLKARLPDKYRDRVSQEITGAAGGPVRIEDLHPLEAKQRLLAIMERLRTPQDSLPPPGGYPPTGETETATPEPPQAECTHVH
jgi:hypothetical protein